MGSWATTTHLCTAVKHGQQSSAMCQPQSIVLYFMLDNHRYSPVTRVAGSLPFCGSARSFCRSMAGAFLIQESQLWQGGCRNLVVHHSPQTIRALYLKRKGKE